MAWCRIGAKALSSKWIMWQYSHACINQLKSLMSRESGKHYMQQLLGVSITHCWFWHVIDDLLLCVVLIMNLHLIKWHIGTEYVFSTHYLSHWRYISRPQCFQIGSSWRFFAVRYSEGARKWMSSLVKIMVCCLIGTKPLSKPMRSYCSLDTQERTTRLSRWKCVQNVVCK